tara:strand:- start:500 stop:874 length:375 start_codon:yes stop_codon:yes gene_type:complete
MVKKDTFYLFKSDKPNKKFVMLMPSYGHIHHFGSSAHRDFTLMNSKSSKFYEPDPVNREKIRLRYMKRHAKNPKGVHSASSMADLILWTKPTIKGGVKAFEDKFNVKIIYKSVKLNEKIKKDLM